MIRTRRIVAFHSTQILQRIRNFYSLLGHKKFPASITPIRVSSSPKSLGRGSFRSLLGFYMAVGSPNSL
jgi:hypothetical protein